VISQRRLASFFAALGLASNLLLQPVEFGRSFSGAAMKLSHRIRSLCESRLFISDYPNKLFSFAQCNPSIDNDMPPHQNQRLISSREVKGGGRRFQNASGRERTSQMKAKSKATAARKSRTNSQG
jgi:hypothetical protein